MDFIKAFPHQNVQFSFFPSKTEALLAEVFSQRVLCFVIMTPAECAVQCKPHSSPPTHQAGRGANDIYYPACVTL